MQTRPATGRALLVCALWIILPSFNAEPQTLSRGVGVYPGDPSEVFSPAMQTDSVHERNLALHRAAYQSDSYDFNLTAQLITDGIIDTSLPGWVVTSDSGGVFPRNEREWILDRNLMTRKTIEGSRAWLRLDLAGGAAPPSVDSLEVSGTLLVDSLPPGHWSVSVSGSPDGTQWIRLGEEKGEGLPGDTMAGWFRWFYPKNLRTFSCPMKLLEPVRCRAYRLDVRSVNARSWAIAELGLFDHGRRTEVGGPYHFASCWKSAGSGNAWVSVDLGALCSVDRIVLHWVRPASEGSVQVSTDNADWKSLAALHRTSPGPESVSLGKKERARYVRILMSKPASADGYILSELEVFGTGGPVAVPHQQAPMASQDRMDLAGGAWKVQRASLVEQKGEDLSMPGYNDSTWLIATVPGTTLVSYLNVGALPDPNFSDNQLLISDSFFYSDFWYRDELSAPESFGGKRVFLTFDGINWKADVFLNGRRLGSIEGAFTRKRFDVTDILRPGERNALAVLIRKNDTPGFVKEQTKLSHDVNGGELGADNPTFHASVGWDWIPTIRGRNTGIWSNVFLSSCGPVTVDDPFVRTTLPLPDTSSADVQVKVTLRNHAQDSVRGELRVAFGPARVTVPLALEPLGARTISLNPSAIASLHLLHPKLWWPNGYGAQHLYPVSLEFFTSDGRRSDSVAFKTGVRQMTSSDSGGALRIWVNGRRFIARGGNWGFSESLLRYRAREYDAAVRYHKEMNFTMIRNWVGQTGDDAFYDACDRYGIMVWQDFWLANPLDGPNPTNDDMFLQNAEDFVGRIRNHPCIALYCGRNEGNPPAAIDSALRDMLGRLQPGIRYIPNSAFGVVSGGGPYRAMPPVFYFDKRATEKLHSEIGMPNMVSYESLTRMLPDSALWPIGRLWGVHDFNLESAQYGYSFLELLSDAFGPEPDLRKWLWLAQWVNEEGYRAMFEAQSRHRMGLLLWMSHPAWPSMVWQTYDYYLEPTAAYFGCKKACEPLHIQWNRLSDSVEVVNSSVPDGDGLSAEAQLVGMDGAVQWRKQQRISCPEDCAVSCFRPGTAKDSSAVMLLRLRLTRGKTVISENSYWRGATHDNLRALKMLPGVRLRSSTAISRKRDRWELATTVVNSSKHPAFLVRFKVTDRAGHEILPAIFSDNFLSLLPGERKTVRMEVRAEDARGEKPEVVIDGFNVW